jgi:carbonic anhydrase
MSKIVAEVTSAKAHYVAGFGDKGNLPMPPGSLPSWHVWMHA